jgi:hypothetical protein
VPFPLYSERFLRLVNTTEWNYFVVPGAKRAVVRNVTLVNDGGSPCRFYVMVAGTIAVNRTVPETDPRTILLELRQVAYAGESIGASSSTAFGHLLVSGYLFDESAAGGGGGYGQQPGPPPPGVGTYPDALPTSSSSRS